jgi:hypothetical protein
MRTLNLLILPLVSSYKVGIKHVNNGKQLFIIQSLMKENVLLKKGEAFVLWWIRSSNV